MEDRGRWWKDARSWSGSLWKSREGSHTAHGPLRRLPHLPQPSFSFYQLLDIHQLLNSTQRHVVVLSWGGWKTPRNIKPKSVAEWGLARCLQPDAVLTHHACATAGDVQTTADLCIMPSDRLQGIITDETVAHSRMSMPSRGVQAALALLAGC